MEEELLLDLTLRDVALSILKIALHHTLGVAQMGFLQVSDQYIELLFACMQSKIYGNKFFIGYGHFTRIKFR
jgi:hypothetical protein